MHSRPEVLSYCLCAAKTQWTNSLYFTGRVKTFSYSRNLFNFPCRVLDFCLFIFLVHHSTQDMAYRPTTGSGVSSYHRMWRTIPPQDLVYHPSIGCGVPSHHRILSFWCLTIGYGRGPTQHIYLYGVLPSNMAVPPQDIFLLDVAYRPTTGSYLSGVLPSDMAGAQHIFIFMVS